MTLIEHLSEFRKRLIISFIGLVIGSVIAFYFSDPIVSFLLKPFQYIEEAAGSQQLYINSLLEGFLTKFRISLLVGIIISLPVHLYNIIRFVFPGLKSKEKNAVTIGLVFSFILIALSFYYSYYKIIPLSVRFLTSRNFIPADVGLLLNYNKNIFYILQLIFIALIIFQTPIILEILLMLGVLKRRNLLRSGKYVIVIIFIISAILTPPDFISQISLALPLILLFFLAILVAKIFKFGED